MDTWNVTIQNLPGAHVLQTAQWAEVKRLTGWKPISLTWTNAAGQTHAAALVLKRELKIGPLATGASVLYIPRGPLLDWADAQQREDILAALEKLAVQERAIWIKIDPDLPVGFGIPNSDDDTPQPVGLALVETLTRRGWCYSNDQVQFANTVWLDLSGGEADWLTRMKPKTRYNLRLAERKGVAVRLGGAEDYAALYRMYAETSVRDGFVIRPEHYYRQVWQTFQQAGLAAPLIAEVGGEMVAGIWVFTFGQRAWYIYGMSRELHREKMPNYLLQWEAMKFARQAGCMVYDLWGAPEIFDESDSLWGVFRFKDGLGGKVVRTVGAWDFIARPGLYRLYTRVLPRALGCMRRRRREETKQEVIA